MAEALDRVSESVDERQLMEVEKGNRTTYASPASEISSVQSPTWFRYCRKSWKRNKQELAGAVTNWSDLEHADSALEEGFVVAPDASECFNAPRATNQT